MLLRTSRHPNVAVQKAEILKQTMAVAADPAQIVIFNSRLTSQGGEASTGEGFAMELLNSDRVQHAAPTLDNAILAAVLATSSANLFDYLGHTMGRG